MAEQVHPVKSEGVESVLVQAIAVARDTPPRQAPNGLLYAPFGENAVQDSDLERLVQTVPAAIAQALGHQTYYFVPLALAEARSAEAAGHRGPKEETMVASAYTSNLAELAICHRNVVLSDTRDGVFISTRLMNDRFSLAFEFFINIGHAFVDTAGVPASFMELTWNQAVADVRGETSQDSWESRNLALGGTANPQDGRPRIDEKAKLEFLESAFSDAVAIYLLSLSTDFDYSELREREYPLLAPQALAERLRLTARLFPPNPGYEFAIRYRRRA